MAGRRARYLRAHLRSWQCLRRPCSARRGLASCMSPAVPVSCMAAMTCWDTPAALTGWPLALSPPETLMGSLPSLNTKPSSRARAPWPVRSVVPFASARASYLISTAAGGRIRTSHGPKLNNSRFQGRAYRRRTSAARLVRTELSATGGRIAPHMNQRGTCRKLHRESFPGLVFPEPVRAIRSTCDRKGSIIPDRRSRRSLTTVDADEPFHGYSFVCCLVVKPVVNVTTPSDERHAVLCIQSGSVAGVARNYLPG